MKPNPGKNNKRPAHWYNCK